jgi:hypothetical protein
MPSLIGYPLNQSPFYRLSSKRKLADLLGFDFSDFASLIDKSNYHEFKNKKGRVIRHPLKKGALDSIHKRVAKFLARVELPNYLYSCKGRSYVLNAAAHAANVPLIKTDISKFYPSTSFSSIFSLFRNRFKCSPDVAWLLAQLCCFNGRHLPTGSYLSGIVAFLAHKSMFDEIYAYSLKHGCTMTCFVDDIVLSGPSATKTLLQEVCEIIRKHGLIANHDKSVTFPANKPRVVTGVVISSSGLSVPNKRLRVIRSDRELIKQTKDSRVRNRMIETLKGRLQAAKQIQCFGDQELFVVEKPQS